MDDSHYHFEERARSKAIASIIGVGVVVTGLYLMAEWFGEPGKTVTIIRWCLIGFLMLWCVLMLPGAISGGSWGCRIIDGRLNWWFPNRFYGKGGSIEVEKIVRLCGDKGGSPRSSIISWSFELKDGERIDINSDCMGHVQKLADALYKLNPRICFETVGFTLMTIGHTTAPWQQVDHRRIEAMK